MNSIKKIKICWNLIQNTKNSTAYALNFYQQFCMLPSFFFFKYFRAISYYCRNANFKCFCTVEIYICKLCFDRRMGFYLRISIFIFWANTPSSPLRLGHPHAFKILLEIILNILVFQARHTHGVVIQ